PGRALFDAIGAELGDLPLIAEHLADRTEPVERMRPEHSRPGMAVMQFAFDPGEPKSPYKLERHEEGDVVYTGTHDHDTARGWVESLSGASLEEFESELSRVGIDEPEPWWSLIRLTMSSRCRTCMVQMQDVLGLGSEARMNTPAPVAPKNGTWRMSPGALPPELAQRLRATPAAAGRLAERA